MRRPNVSAIRRPRQGGARVVVTRYSRRQAVILSAEEYDSLLAEEEVDLSTLERKFDQMVARMQTPEHRGAVESRVRFSVRIAKPDIDSRSYFGRSGPA